MIQAKPFAIPKRMVWEAFEKVKAKQGAPGIDGQRIEDFEQDLRRNLYRIWNRMSSGSYHPPPVLRVEIPKRDGGVRVLGIPTVEDRVAQAVVKMHLEPIVERVFHPDSYGYRPGRSAHDAVETARRRCWTYGWVLDLDIRSFFDRLDHGLVMRAVRRFTDCRWVLLYIERWLKADLQDRDGQVVHRDLGTPQGGVISPLLANIFLHLAFDQWMHDNFRGVPFERYADDIVVHCRSKAHAEWMLIQVEKRLKHCRLELHPEKTRIVCCTPVVRTRNEVRTFDFLGFTFQPRLVKSRTGQLFVSYSPAIGRKAACGLRQTMRRGWRLPTRTKVSLDELAARINPILEGWIHYYGRFRPSALVSVLRGLNVGLRLWVMRKYKRFKGRPQRAMSWLRRIAERDPGLFAHWRIAGLFPTVAAGR